MHDQTTTAIAREASVLPATVRLYADLGLLDYITSSEGRRLFQKTAAQRVREIYAERMARRGRRAA